MRQHDSSARHSRVLVSNPARRYIVPDHLPRDMVLVHANKRTWMQRMADDLLPCHCCWIDRVHCVQRVKPRTVGRKPTLALLLSLRGWLGFRRRSS